MLGMLSAGRSVEKIRRIVSLLFLYQLDTADDDTQLEQARPSYKTLSRMRTTVSNIGTSLKMTRPNFLRSTPNTKR
jgi:hypothetical protein